ncbi:hypothetical protein Ancab_035994 [Ancistrocladus abbreviatus]
MKCVMSSKAVQRKQEVTYVAFNTQNLLAFPVCVISSSEKRIDAPFLIRMNWIHIFIFIAPFDIEVFADVSFKHPRIVDSIDDITPYLDIVSSKDVSRSLTIQVY